MNARLAKEVRALLWPAALAALCSVVVLARPIFLQSGTDWSHNFASFLFGLAQFGFCAGIIFLAATSFGAEFQQRTFVMLLSQPAERSGVWRDKMLVLTAIIPAVAVVGLIYYVVGKSFHDKDVGGTVLGVLFVAVVIICATPFWTLLARSTIGGVVFSLSVTFMGGGILQAVLEKVVGNPVDPTPEAIARRNLLMGAPMIAAGVAYAGLCLWLGWRKFATMELRDGQSGEGIPFPKTFPGAKWLANLLRCSPTGAMRNLVRKELRLQKPIFLLASLFIISWLGILGWSWLFPEQVARPAALTALSVIYLLFVAMLTGCAAFDEERTLGLAAWHLTLPPSAWRQWLVKFGVAASVFALLGIVLPLVLAIAFSGETREAVLAQLERGKESWMLAFGLLFVLGFWAASLTGNMVRAVLTTILTCFAFGTLLLLAQWIAQQFGGLQSALVESLIMKLQWSPSALLDFHNRHREWPFLLVPAVVCPVAFLQSYGCFRRSEAVDRLPFRSPLILAATSFLIFLWIFDVSLSGDRAFQSLQTKLSAVVQSLRLRESDFPPPGKWGSMPIIKLEQFEDPSQPIPPRIKAWLANTTIKLYQNPPTRRSEPSNPDLCVLFFFSSNASDGHPQVIRLQSTEMKSN